MEVALLHHRGRNLPHFHGNYQALRSSFHCVDKALNEILTSRAVRKIGKGRRDYLFVFYLKSRNMPGPGADAERDVITYTSSRYRPIISD